MMDKPLSFGFSREKDENEQIKALSNGFISSMLISNETLNPFDINRTFGFAEALYLNLKHRISEDSRSEIINEIDVYKRLYTEALGIQKGGGDRGSSAFLYNLNEQVKKIFNLVRGSLENS